MYSIDARSKSYWTYFDIESALISSCLREARDLCYATGTKEAVQLYIDELSQVCAKEVY